MTDIELYFPAKVVLIKNKKPRRSRVFNWLSDDYFLSEEVASAVVAFLLPQSEEALSDLSPHDEEHDDDFLSDFADFFVPSALGFFSVLTVSMPAVATPVAAATVVAE